MNILAFDLKEGCFEHSGQVSRTDRNQRLFVRHRAYSKSPEVERNYKKQTP